MRRISVLVTSHQFRSIQTRHNEKVTVDFVIVEYQF